MCHNAGHSNGQVRQANWGRVGGHPHPPTPLSCTLETSNLSQKNLLFLTSFNAHDPMWHLRVD